ncbi:MAG: translation initiation factor IF-2 [Rhodospirillaceae bacterium]|nr:translation initiation factor IF-2 [Rhodospirillaceae bacterium]|tara:strand:+ start:3997 stop:6627 length:2631 start_codon:yes stop_codon:yes gene_type:complete
MAGDDDSDKKPKTLSLNRPRLEIKTTVDGGQVRQSFSHGRSKQVAVEVKKRRVIRPGRDDTEAAPAPEPVEEAAPASAPEPVAEAPAPKPVAEPVDTPTDARPSLVLKDLSNEEREGRARALAEARKTEEEARKQAEIDAARRAEEEAREAVERAEAEKRANEDDARREREEEARLRAEEQAQRLEGKQRDPEVDPEAIAAAQAAAAQPAAPVAEDEDKKRSKRDRRSPLAPKTRPSDRRRSGKLTIAQALAGDDGEERARSLAAAKRAREKLRQQQAGQQQSDGSSKKFVREVVVPEAILVGELANRMAVRGGEVVKKLMQMGQMVTINQTIDADTAELLVEEFGHKIRRVSESDVEVGLKQDDDPDETKKPRAPVVTVMGHVDHGKTSLLDALRKTDVVAGEAGGITQHIGAYQVVLQGGERITFLDTPGHAAFTAMRARGASVTDIVILVVAADDSVMPQTKEAIDHARAADVPIIVAINKCDTPGADPDKVRQDLLQHELVVEGMGGDILDVEVSALKGDGLDKLEEAILLQAELLELKANPDRTAEGVVVEARLEKGRGAVSTVLVQRGTLHVGDTMVVGKEWGRIRALIDDRGKNVKEAGPSIPVEVLGLSGAPTAGDEFFVVDNEKRAREIAAYRDEQERQQKITSVGSSTVEQLFANIAAGETKELPLVIKTDVHGSAEAITHSLEDLGTDEVKPRVLLSAVGGISESDVTLAKASNAIIFGFNIRANSQARQLAEKEGVEIRYYRIIYELLDEAKTMLSGMLAPATEEKVLGAAQVLDTFEISKVGRIAGCRIMDGLVRRTAKVRLLRDGHILFDGHIKSLKHHKDEVREIKQGSECGIQLDGHHDIEIGDEIEAYELNEIARSLDD